MKPSKSCGRILIRALLASNARSGRAKAQRPRNGTRESSKRAIPAGGIYARYAYAREGRGAANLTSHHAWRARVSRMLQGSGGTAGRPGRIGQAEEDGGRAAGLGPPRDRSGR